MSFHVSVWTRNRRDRQSPRLPLVETSPLLRLGLRGRVDPLPVNSLGDKEAGDVYESRSRGRGGDRGRTEGLLDLTLTLPGMVPGTGTCLVDSRPSSVTDDRGVGDRSDPDTVAGGGSTGGLVVADGSTYRLSPGMDRDLSSPG